MNAADLSAGATAELHSLLRAHGLLPAYRQQLHKGTAKPSHHARSERLLS
jgi:hypothetical protein